MKKLTDKEISVVSLFSGIGGLDIGLHDGLVEAGFKTNSVIVEAFAEVASFPIAILLKHFAEVPNLGDVKTVNAADVGSPTIIAGGFPCQDISAAKKDALGLAGERSGLWKDMARLIKASQPKVAIVENVEAIRRMGLWKVLSDLVAAGYVAQYDIVSAYSVGAPHQRERCFIVAQRKDLFDGKLCEFAPEDVGLWKKKYPYPWADEKRTKNQLNAMAAVGNAVSPPVAAVIGRAVGALLKGAAGVERPTDGGVALNKNTLMPRAGFVDAKGKFYEIPSSTKKEIPKVRFDELPLEGDRKQRTKELAARVASRRLPTPTYTDWKGGGTGGEWDRSLRQGMGGWPSPAFLEWLMGFPIGWTDL